MHNMVSLLCEQPVQNLWIYHSKTCGDISTDDSTNIVCRIYTRVKVWVVRIILPMSSQYLPTHKKTLFDLLLPSYPHYPQDLLLTPPNEI